MYCEENCTLKSSFQLCIPISRKSTFFHKMKERIQFQGGNRESMVNTPFSSLFKIFKHLWFNTLQILYFFSANNVEAQSPNTIHTDLLHFTLHSKIKPSKGFHLAFSSFTEVTLLHRLVGKGLYKQTWTLGTMTIMLDTATKYSKIPNDKLDM